MNKPLEAYEAKRDFSKTPEPKGKPRARKGGDSFVIQKHAARRLHYDFRLEMDGVLKSWAVPEGPSLVPGEKRLAVHVEDHPLEYGGFEGVIPKGEYGGGTVMIWDRGTWSPDFDPAFGYKKGHLKFHLDGDKLKGQWHLVRMRPKPREKQEAWLLFKSEDEASRDAGAPAIVEEMPDSAASGRTMEEIARRQDRVWSSKRGEITPETAPEAKRRPALQPGKIARAKKGTLPAFVEPALPSAVDAPSSGKDWVHEIKYDGYRIQARIADGKARLLTRSGLDWTERFGGLAKAFAGLPVRSAIIDGEVVVQTEAGVASFTRLVDTLKEGGGRLIYYAFDLLFADGYDLREATLTARKAALAKIVAGEGGGPILYSEHIGGAGGTILAHTCRLGLEGIVSKKASAPYRSGRIKTWTKSKCAQEGEFVIAGFMISTVAKKAVGSLVLAEHVGKKLVASGHVGSGFTSDVAKSLWETLEPLRTTKAPIVDDNAKAKGARWVEPNLVAEIEYRARTGTGLIRHATFKGLAEGRDPAEVIRPKDVPVGAGGDVEPAARLTNPARLLWPEEGVTKQGLADFYAEIAERILPHIVDRPLSLVRCPGGIGEECFFQKHKWAGLTGAVRLVPVPGDDEPMLAIDSVEGLLDLVQASVLEIHPWGSKAEHPELPDRIILDLDPGDAVPWEHVVEAARDVRERLSALKLESFVKTTGGKGLHVVVPIATGPDWETVKSFAHGVASAMAAERSDRYLDTMAKRIRRGRIYVDYVRNGMGATAVAAYSTRARPGAAVSTPLAWDELGPAISPSHFTVENLPTRLAFLDRDPWEGFFELEQALPSAEGAPARKTASRKRTAKKP